MARSTKGTRSRSQTASRRQHERKNKNKGIMDWEKGNKGDKDGDMFGF